MPRGMLSDLQNPNHLVDRRLHAFEQGDFDRMVLAAGGKSKEYVQLDREARAKAAFAPAKTPDKRDQMAKNWHDAVWRAFPSEILGRGEEPSGGKPTVVLRVDYYEGKNTVGFMELAKRRVLVGRLRGDAGGRRLRAHRALRGVAEAAQRGSTPGRRAETVNSALSRLGRNPGRVPATSRDEVAPAKPSPPHANRRTEPLPNSAGGDHLTLGRLRERIGG